MAVLVFEGPDGVGKTTLFKAVAKARNYRDVYVDRMFVSDEVYAKKFNRELPYTFYDKADLFISLIKPIYIFVTAEVNDILKTFEERKENVPAENEIRNDILLFEQAYEKLPSPRKMLIRRTDKSIEETVDQVIRAIENIELNY